ncbi:geranylgeranyl pyrophosphate synthetase [Thoreauomyces humboldtii]|nr:geranylgeranyl pyrophosphate synthetase [Thoreauomyces humboldtii]
MSYLSDNMSPMDSVLLEPFLYLTENPGKEIRTKLLEAFSLWLKVPAAKLKTIREAVEMLHTASLLEGGAKRKGKWSGHSRLFRHLDPTFSNQDRIDDVEDDSVLRRGRPVAHQIFGTAAAINCANYVYFLALQKLQTLEDPRAVTIFTEELLQLHRGQGMEIHWRDTGNCPTEEEYMEMVKNKTGGLLRLAIKLMQVSTESPIDYTPLVDIIGIHYQIRDDYMNLQSSRYTNNKGFAEDLTEGKFSFPILHSIRADPSNRQLQNILKQKTTSPELKRFAIDLMDKTQSFAYVRSCLERIEGEARDEIRRLGGNVMLERYLDSLRNDMADRPVGGS